MTSSLESRPFIGTWRLNNRSLVQYTPDCLVFVNGDTSLPGCSKCNGKIDIQPFITQVSVDAGIDAGSHQANFNLSVPKHLSNSFSRDAKYLIRPSMEIHIYFKGYFPLEGMYENINTEQLGLGDVDISGVLNYPYYHVFHGVITQVDINESGGFQQFTVNCASMLYFWQYHDISTNASYFGARPANSKLKMSLVGHNFCGKSPYQIIYTLFHDVMGAASGVAFAFSDKSNAAAVTATARTGETGESMFSVALEYWRKRFSTKVNNLRLFGASGRLFNTAQASWLGQTSTSAIMAAMDSRFESPEKAGMDIFPASWYTQTASQLIEQEQSRPNGVPINVIEKQAFINDIGQWGQVNLFEASYETKLDIANKVVEVTGWEFFQDVDGDFVFKPPFFNLDTSASRVYRLENSDLIDFSHSVKEPAATLITCKGAQFKNYTGMGLDNEWGVRGQYIDYKLVAQFGWRPHSFDTAYFNDPKSMFFAAANILDVMNSKVNTGSATIPIRPELRPGYPVYVAKDDCFYYVESLSHSYQPGGACTTSLSLTAKRAKFYPPGNVAQPDAPISDIVQLDKIWWPERPIRILDNGGEPRLAGFPNVVMALDTERLTPSFAVMGFDSDHFESLDSIRLFLDEAVDRLGIGKRVEGQEGVYSMPAGENDTEEILFSISNDFPKAVNLSTATAEWQQGIDKGYSANTQATTAVAKAEKNLQDLEKQYKIALEKKNDKEAAKLKANISKDTGILKDLRVTAKDLVKTPFAKGSDVAKMLDLIKMVQGKMLKSGNYPDKDSTANLLDLLGDKKAAMTCTAQPGYYRYFSSSHPSHEQQGQKKLTLNKDGKTLEPRIVSDPVRVLRFTGASEPYRLELVEASDVWGIEILSNDPENPQKVVSTDQIKTLEFAINSIQKPQNRTLLGGRGSPATVAERYSKNIIDSAPTEIPADSAILASVFSESLKNFTPSLSEITVNSKKLYLSQTFKQAKTALNLNPSQTLGAIARALGKQGKKQHQNLAAKNYVQEAAGKVKADQKPAPTKTETADAKNAVTGGITTVTSWISKSVEKLATAAVDSAKVRVAKASVSKREIPTKEVKAPSPVFPVSDGRGYEVIGAYRYGRDISIEPNGSLDQIVRYDPFQFADQQTLNKVIGGLTAGKSMGDQTEALISSIWNNSMLAGRSGDILPRVDYSSTAPDQTAVIQNGLRNLIATALSGEAKQPVANNAYSLAALQVHSNQQPCECRAAEANVLVAALSNDFTEITVEPVPSDLDSMTGAYRAEMMAKALAWKQQQDALRGKALSSGSLYDTLSAEAGRLQRASVTVESAKRDLLAESDRLA